MIYQVPGSILRDRASYKLGWKVNVVISCLASSSNGNIGDILPCKTIRPLLALVRYRRGGASENRRSYILVPKNCHTWYQVLHTRYGMYLTRLLAGSCISDTKRPRIAPYEVFQALRISEQALVACRASIIAV